MNQSIFHIFAELIGNIPFQFFFEYSIFLWKSHIGFHFIFFFDLLFNLQQKKFYKTGEPPPPSPGKHCDWIKNQLFFWFIWPFFFLWTIIRKEKWMKWFFFLNTKDLWRTHWKNFEFTWNENKKFSFFYLRSSFCPLFFFFVGDRKYYYYYKPASVNDKLQLQWNKERRRKEKEKGNGSGRLIQVIYIFLYDMCVFVWER